LVTLKASKTILLLPFFRSAKIRGKGFIKQNFLKKNVSAIFTKYLASY
jgi:hypothetical protein